MKLNKKTLNLISTLECIIGGETYNPNSLNGYTWEEGCEFRYPLTYNDKDGDEQKCRSQLVISSKDVIPTMRYKFGSNHLYIGNAIVRALEYIEKEYGIDFDQLAKTAKK